MALKIMSLPVDDGGCGWYRIRQPFEFIKRFSQHDTHIIDQSRDNMVEVVKALNVADLLVARPGAEEGIKHILSMPEYQDKKWILDIDDNIELISPYSNHYEEYGTDNFYDSNIKRWLWRDGESGFDVKQNKIKVQKHIEGIKNANLVTVTTKQLALYVKQYNRSVAILPNSINFDRWWPLNLRPNNELRIGWSGGSSHYEDWYDIKEPLNTLMRKYKFKLIMAGHSFPGVIDEDNKYLVEIHDWIPFKGHSYRMMCMALDIAIIPLANLMFNYFKSSIKWYEMSAMKVPCVVSDITPYSEEIKCGKTALGYRTDKQFYDALEKMILSSATRKKIGENAYKWVKENRDAEKNTKLWVKAYESILKN